MLTKDHKEETFSESNIGCFEHISIIELYSFLLDAFYPQITKKEDRPQLIYDKLEDYKKQLEKNKNYQDKIVKILKDSLKLLETLCDHSYPKNTYCECQRLTVLGTIEMYNKNPKKAVYYFEKAQDVISECHSEELKQIDSELTDSIILAQKFF